MAAEPGPKQSRLGARAAAETAAVEEEEEGACCVVRTACCVLREQNGPVIQRGMEMGDGDGGMGDGD